MLDTIDGSGREPTQSLLYLVANRAPQDGRLRGVILTEHYEPYGDFSIERPEFVAQFENKDIRNRFRLGEDIDAVSRATITVRSASRAVRNSSRRIARAYLTPPSQ